MKQPQVEIGEFMYQENFLHIKVCEALEQAAQGSGITIHGCIQKACGYATWRSGLMMNTMLLGLQLDSMIFKVFPNLNDSNVAGFLRAKC